MRGINKQRVFQNPSKCFFITLKILKFSINFLKKSISQLDQAYEICRKETQQWAKTFYLGTLLLPIKKRKAIWAIYVWCRRTDEIMDSAEASTKSQDELSDNLDKWEENTKNIFKGKTVSIFGGGDRALDRAVELSNNCNVNLIHRRDEFRGAQATVDKVHELSKSKKINLFTKFQLKKHNGSNKIESIDIEDDAVLVKQWSETDFRTNENPWWA